MINAFLFYSQLKYHEPVENFSLNAILESNDKVLHNQNMVIFIIEKLYSVLIQTDKPVYKPGDKFLYRILALDTYLKPYEVADGRLRHNIYDGLGNLPPEPARG